MAWYQHKTNSIVISVHAQPGARLNKTRQSHNISCEIQGLHGDALKIRVAAQPVEGRANAEIIRFLAKKLGVPQHDVSLISGETSRHKRFRIICATGTVIDPTSLLDSE